MIENVILPAGIFALMFGLGLSLEWRDFQRVAQSPLAFFAGTMGMLVFVPIYGFFLVKLFDVAAELAMGVMLIATAPGGLFSNLFTHLGRGNLALSIALTSAISFTYIVSIPFIAAFLYGHFLGDKTTVESPVVDIAIPLVFLTLLPVVLGMTVTRYAEGLSASIQEPLRKFSAIFIFAAFVAIAYVQRETLLASIEVVALPVMLLNAGAITIGFVLTRIFRLNLRDSIAVTVEHSVRQEGTAIFIAASVLNSPQMALPLILNGAFGLSLSFLFIHYANKHAEWFNQKLSGEKS